MVTAKWVECWNMSISMLWGKCPKMTIVCGNCYHTFTDRPPMSNHITSVCPACKEVNQTIGIQKLLKMRYSLKTLN